MTMEYVSLRPDMTVEEAILRIRRQGVDKETIYTCYVLDKDRTLLGIVTVDDAMEVIEDNVEEGRTRWAWGQFAITLAVFIVLMIPYTFFVLRMFGHN